MLRRGKDVVEVARGVDLWIAFKVEVMDLRHADIWNKLGDIGLLGWIYICTCMRITDPVDLGIVLLEKMLCNRVLHDGLFILSDI